MRNVFTLVLLVGLALAGVAVYVVQNYIGSYQQALRAAQQQAQQQQNNVNMVEVYVATRDIRYGEDILTEDVRKVRWAADALPVGVFSTQNPLYKEGDKPRVALRAIDVNEPILMSKVTEPGVPAGLISQLEPGLRGYAISVNTITGVAGFLRPHDLIDIYWTSTPNIKDETDPNEKIFLITRLIASSVKIIAVDQNYLADENGAPPRGEHLGHCGDRRTSGKSDLGAINREFVDNSGRARRSKI